MAGVKGRSGGARPGAGRKPKKAAATGLADPLEFLKAVWLGNVDANVAQVRAATAALPFVHKKLGEGGKAKDEADAAQKAASGGKFGRRGQPRLATADGKPV